MDTWLMPIPDPASTASVFQVVAYNLRRGREERAMTQRVFGQAMEKVTGTPWSVMMVSQAERGWTYERDKRVRHFDANEIVAFAIVLRVPVPWFFLPPPAQTTGYPPSSPNDPWITAGETGAGLSINAMTSLAVAHPDHLPADDILLTRLQQEAAAFAPTSQPRLDRRTKKFIRAVRDAVDDLDAGDVV